jgi:hypothetical protein
MDPWGHSLSRSVTTEHILGLRQYELTNHTQNVMAVVLDKRYIRTTGNNFRDRFIASISAAYDYYPYGMLMPHRTTADTTTHCMTVMKEVRSPYAFSVYADMAKAKEVLGGTFTPPGTPGIGLGTTVYGTTGGMTLELKVTPGEAVDVRTDIVFVYGFGVNVTVTETGASGVVKMLGSKMAGYPGLVTIPVRPSVGKITVQVANLSSFATVPPSGLFTVGSISYDSLVYQVSYLPTLVCNKNTDKYPFGFNGQMKSNDVAGIGNFNTAEFWEYNTRTGRRLNLDPQGNAWESMYSVLGGNPILNVDILGNKWETKEDKN